MKKLQRHKKNMLQLEFYFLIYIISVDAECNRDVNDRNDFHFGILYSYSGLKFTSIICFPLDHLSDAARDVKRVRCMQDVCWNKRLHKFGPFFCFSFIPFAYYFLYRLLPIHRPGRFIGRSSNSFCIAQFYILTHTCPWNGTKHEEPLGFVCIWTSVAMIHLNWTVQANN